MPLKHIVEVEQLDGPLESFLPREEHRRGKFSGKREMKLSGSRTEEMVLFTISLSVFHAQPCKLGINR